MIAKSILTDIILTMNVYDLGLWFFFFRQAEALKLSVTGKEWHILNSQNDVPLLKPELLIRSNTTAVCFPIDKKWQ